MGRTSNPGADELQDLEIDGQKLYISLVNNILKEWNVNGNCLIVVGATQPAELAEVRKAAGDEMVFLVPGIGAQGGDVEATVRAGANSQGKGIIVNSSRDIIYASQGEDFAEAAKARATAVRDEIIRYRGVSDESSSS